MGWTQYLELEWDGHNTWNESGMDTILGMRVGWTQYLELEWDGQYLELEWDRHNT